MTHLQYGLPELPEIDFAGEQINIGDTSEVVTKYNRMLDKMQQWTKSANAVSADLLNDVEQSEIHARRLSTAGTNAYLNYCSDHGTFLKMQEHPTGDDGWNSNNNPAEFRPNALTDFLVSFNGSSINRDGGIIEATRSIYNSVDFGGSQPANPDDITNIWFPKMGGGGRYMPEFAVAQYTTGDGTDSTSVDDHYYHANSNNLTSLANAYNAVSGSLYIRCVNNDMLIQGNAAASSLQCFVDGKRLNSADGEFNGGNYHRLKAGEVYHVAITFQLTATQHTLFSFIRLLTKQNSIMQCALPWFSAGRFQMPPHMRPIRSIGTTGALLVEG